MVDLRVYCALILGTSTGNLKLLSFTFLNMRVIFVDSFLFVMLQLSINISLYHREDNFEDILCWEDNCEELSEWDEHASVDCLSAEVWMLTLLIGYCYLVMHLLLQYPISLCSSWLKNSKWSTANLIWIVKRKTRTNQMIEWHDPVVDQGTALEELGLRHLEF